MFGASARKARAADPWLATLIVELDYRGLAQVSANECRIASRVEHLNLPLDLDVEFRAMLAHIVRRAAMVAFSAGPQAADAFVREALAPRLRDRASRRRQVSIRALTLLLPALLMWLCVWQHSTLRTEYGWAGALWLSSACVSLSAVGVRAGLRWSHDGGEYIHSARLGLAWWDREGAIRLESSTAAWVASWANAQERQAEGHPRCLSMTDRSSRATISGPWREGWIAIPTARHQR